MCGAFYVKMIIMNHILEVEYEYNSESKKNWNIEHLELLHIEHCEFPTCSPTKLTQLTLELSLSKIFRPSVENKSK